MNKFFYFWEGTRSINVLVAGPRGGGMCAWDVAQGQHACTGGGRACTCAGAVVRGVLGIGRTSCVHAGLQRAAAVARMALL